MNLIDLGWNDFFKANYSPYKEQNLYPARVVRVNKNNFILIGETGEMTAQAAGKMLNETYNGLIPVVGDWVVIDPGNGQSTIVIQSVLPRKSGFERKVAGDKTKVQVAAANVDTVFLVNGLDDDFNPRRIERYLTTVWDSGASPVIVLNKVDICDDPDDLIKQVDAVAMGVPVLSVSALNDIGMDDLSQYLKPGSTIALLGSSGVGKSTIINYFLGFDKMKVQSTSEEKSKGRHTTTHRELVQLENGALFIDTPGMRELQLWGDEENLKHSFVDIDQIAQNCKFIDCKHVTEPGCAVKQALDSGEIDEKRYENYQKMLRELKHLSRRKDQLGRHLEKQRGKKFASMIKQTKRLKKMTGQKHDY